MADEARLSAVVMAHPARIDHARALVATAEDAELRIVTDPAPHRGPATMRTARLAWAAIEPGASHHLVVQDDARLPTGFLTQARQAATRQPDVPLVFYTEWGSKTAGAVRIAALTAHAWTDVVDDYVPTQALLLPAALAAALAEHFESLPESTPDDEAVHPFLVSRGLTARICVPNLVDHADLPSLIGNQHFGARHSACHTTELATAAIADTAPLTGLAAVPYFSHWTAHCRIVHGDRWRREPAAKVLNRLGIDDRPGQRALRELDGIRPSLNRAMVTELWRAALLTGYFAAAHGPIDLDTPVARQALRTMAPGALSRLVDPAESPDAYQRLTVVVNRAVRDGAAAHRSGQ
jgi:hypothetical protein